MKRLIFMLGALVSLTMCSFEVSAKMPRVMKMPDIKPGTKAIGFSVFRGVEPEAFDVELGNTLQDGDIEYAFILASGKPSGMNSTLEQTSVIPGMSGSPVFVRESCATLDECIDHGILIGAVSLRMTVFHLAGMNGAITPAELMLGARSRGFSATPATRSAFLLPGGMQLPLLASFPPGWSGMSPWNAVHSVSGADFPACKDAQPAELKPGSMISVFLAVGNMPIALSGTVTWRDGSTIWAFGHPLFVNNMGPVRYPFAQVRVSETLQSSYASTKVAGCTVGNAGVITTDSPTEISGEIGKAVTPISLRAVVRIGNATFSLQEDVVPDTPLTEKIVTQIPQLWASRVMGVRKNVSFQYLTRIVLRGQPEIFLHNSGFIKEANGLPMQISAGLLYILGELEKTEFPFSLESVQMEVELLDNLVRWEKEKIFLSKIEAVPGETVTLSIVLRKFPAGTPLRMIEIPITVPADILLRKQILSIAGLPPISLPSGVGAQIEVLVQDGLQFTDKRSNHEAPRSLDVFIEKFNRNNGTQANTVYVQQVFPPRTPNHALPGKTSQEKFSEKPPVASSDLGHWKDVADLSQISAGPDDKPDVLLQALPELDGVVSVAETLRISVKAPPAAEPAESKTEKRKKIFFRPWRYF